MTFIPDADLSAAFETPYFEDQSGISGSRTSKSPESLMNEAAHWLNELGALNVIFKAGRFPFGKSFRYGYRVSFSFAGTLGRIECAALPLRKETEAKKSAALAQALYLLRDTFKAQALSRVYQPDTIPLLPYLIDERTDKTVTQALVESRTLPLLSPGN